MVLPHSKGDLYHKYRPCRFNEIAGHKALVSSIRSAVTAKEPSQAYLLLGASGTGKTTAARIMAMSLNCDNKSKDGDPCLTCEACKAILSGNCTDMLELNAADNRGINDIRSITQSMPLMPMQLTNKVYILDEAHQLTNEAQSSLLKVLEEAPSHVFIILCSTHPKKILPTVKNRCQRFTFTSLKQSEMLGLVEEVATLEGEDLPQEAYEAIVDASGGSPRSALVSLQQVLQLESRELTDILKLVVGEDESDPNVVNLCFALNNRTTKWNRVVEAYKEVKHIGPPGIGMIMAGFYRNQLLKSGNIYAAKKLKVFLEPFPEGKLGENQLVHALYLANEG